MGTRSDTTIDTATAGGGRSDHRDRRPRAIRAAPRRFLRVLAVVEAVDACCVELEERSSDALTNLRDR